MNQKRILVLTNPRSFKGSLIKWMANCWSDSGYAVEFTSDLHTKKNANIIFLHVDLTNVPSIYNEYVRRFPKVINGYNSSISKELFSNQIISQNSGYKGKVIVKTVANYGGLPELTGKNISWIQGIPLHIIKMLALSTKFNNRYVKSIIWKKVRILDPSCYPIFDSIGDVPSGVWENTHLIVEKFLPERKADGRYVLRHWYFFGEKEFSRTLESNSPIPKWQSMGETERILSREEWWNIDVNSKENIPREVRFVREKLHMDFGRIDWVFNEGKPVIFDANKTPSGIGVKSLDTELDRHRNSIICDFSAGLEKFMN